MSAKKFALALLALSCSFWVSQSVLANTDNMDCFALVGRGFISGYSDECGCIDIPFSDCTPLEFKSAKI